MFLYSLLNEEPLQKEVRGKRIAAKLRSAILELDCSRAITGAINGAENITGESAADVLDVMGMNYSVGSYEKLYKAQGKVILGTENGPVYATRGVYRTDREAQIYASYSDELTAFGQSYEETLRAAKEHEYIAGVFLWSCFDYHGEPQPFSWPSVLSHWGMCDICGFEKDIYYHVMSFYSDVPMIHVLPAWQDYEEGEAVRVAAFTNCREVSFYLNGKLVGTALAEGNRAEITVPFKVGELTAVASQDGVTVSDTVKTCGAASMLKAEVRTDGRYKIVDVTAVDKDGIPVNSADNTVKLAVSGGRVIGCGNGDPNAPIDCTSDSIAMFHGKCQFTLVATDSDVSAELISDIGTATI